VLAVEQERGSVKARTPGQTFADTPTSLVKHRQDAVLPEETEEGKPSLEFLLLYEQYKRPIHTYVSRLLFNREDADDVTQEVFLRAFVGWNDLTDRDHLSTWLYRVATNLCVDLLRRRKRISWWPLTRRRAGNLSLEGGDQEDASYLPPDQGGIPEIFEREHIRLVLAGMPPDYAIVLVLSAAQGLSYQEIATIVGVSPSAAATRLSRAKRMFADHYRRLHAEDTGKGKKEI
jgi:RNA polymerase sigma-70 factor (ECF subfamily)